MLAPFVSDVDLTLYVGDCLMVARELEPCSVDAIVTSPPYADARADYPHTDPGDFPAWIASVLDATLPLLSESGSVMLNLGRLFRDGREIDYLERTLLCLAHHGWLRLDTIIWWKPNAPARSGPYLTNAHEFIYWLARTPDAYRGLDECRTPYAPSTLARYSRNWARNTRVKGHHAAQSGRDAHPGGARPSSVVVETVGREKGNPHPAPMPALLAEYLIGLACPPGGTVLDPFAGSGTTLRAARKLGRASIGIELSEEYARLAAKRLQQLSLLA